MLARFSTPEAPSVLRRIDVREKLVALTFDDGPTPAYTRRLMTLLEHHQIPATFFFIGRQVERYPEIAREAARRGFEIGNHSYAHPDLRQMPELKARDQVDRGQTAFTRAGAPLPELMRFPYGSSTKALRRHCQSLGVAMIAWDIDTRDWEPDATARGILRNIDANLAPGSIVLMHERPEPTHEALPLVVDLLNRRGYRPVTVSELLLAGYEGR
jgi:peptidoglycan/xylan/chitin deacetylase (PgdA/CDA1 family)